MAERTRYYKQDGTEYDFSKEPEIKITQTSNADMNIGIPKKLTAVSWLEDRLKETYDKEGKLPLAYTLSLVEQAKRMETDQLMEKYGEGYHEGLYDQHMK